MSAHARIGPSSLKRTINCPGSVREIEKLKRTSNDAADEGSCLHAYCEEILLNPFIEPHDLVGKTYEHNGYRLTITEEHAEHATPAIDWVREQPGELLVEQRVFLDPWMPEQFGTCDVGILTDDLVIIADWKWGAGVPVKVADNPQLMAYALGFLHTVLRPRGVEPKTFRLIIEQPRNHAGGRFWEPWDVSLEDLLAFGEVLKATYKAVMDPNAPCIAGDWCEATFCDYLKAGCPAYDKWMNDFFDGALLEMDDLDAEPQLPDAYTMTPERRWWIVKHQSQITKWLSRLHADSMAAAAAGEPDPGSKLVLGQKGNRYYTDEEAAETILTLALGDDAFTKKLKSPAQAESAMKPKRKKGGYPKALAALNELVTQDDGKPILVPESDDRPAYVPADAYLDELEDFDVDPFD